MRKFAVVVAWGLLASLGHAQGTDTFKPAETNVLGAEYPRVDAEGRVQIGRASCRERV